MLIVPAAFGVSGWLNDQWAGKKIDGVNSANDMIKWSTGTPVARSVYVHSSAATAIRNDTQTVFCSDVLKKDYNEQIVTAAIPTQWATHVQSLLWNLNMTTDWAINHGLSMVRLWLNTTSDRQWQIRDYAAYTYNTGNFYTYCDWKLRVDPATDTIEGGGVFESPMSSENTTWGYPVATGLVMNITNEWRYWDFTISQLNLLRTATAFDGQTHTDHTDSNETLTIALINPGDTTGTSINVGDDIKWRIEYFSATINPFATTELVVAGIGFGLIALAVMATPAWNLARRRRRNA